MSCRKGGDLGAVDHPHVGNCGGPSTAILIVVAGVGAWQTSCLRLVAVRTVLKLEDVGFLEVAFE